MFYSHLLLIFGVSFLFLSVSQGGPVLRNGTYVVKEGSLLSQQWKIATLEFDVGEDLYFPVVLPCLHCDSKQDYKKNDEGEVCVCNFSSKEACGSAPKECPDDTCKEEDVRRYCNSEKLSHWEKLHYKTKTYKEINDGEDEFWSLQDQTLTEDQVKYYRLQISDPCASYFIKANFQYGIADIFLSTSNPEPSQLDLDEYTDFARYPDHIEILLCPDASVFQLGTYFFSFIGRSPNVSFDIDVYSTQTLHSTPRPSPTTVTTNPICKDDARFICLQDGVSSVIPLSSSSDFTPYRYDVTTTEPDECVTLTFFVQVETGDGDLFGDWDNPVLEESYNPIYRSSLQGSDIIYTERCFSSPGTYHFFALVEAWDPGLYFISVSTETRGFLRRALDYSPYQYSYIATRFLFGKCPGYHTSTQVNLICADWGFSCRSTWSVFPSVEQDPFWPIPSVWNVRTSPFSASLFATLRQHDIPSEVTIKSKITISVLLENTIFGKNNVFLREEQLAGCYFTSMGHAFSKDRKSLVGTAYIEKQPQFGDRCDPAKFHRVLDTGREYTKELQEGDLDFNKALQLSYQINTLMFSSTWSACEKYGKAFLNSTTQIEPTLSTGCLISNTSSVEYLTDPCCNNKLLPYQCCNPRIVHEAKTSFHSYLPEQIEEQCSSGTEECVESYVGDYLVVNQKALQCTSFSSDEYPKIVIKGVDFYRQCKDKYNIDSLALGEVKCRFDEECYFNGWQGKCNLVTNRCIGSYELEKQVLQCVLEGLDEYKEFYLKEALNLPGRKNDSLFFEGFQKALQKDQCLNYLGHQDNQRQSYIYTTKDPFCGSSLNCLSRTCLDTSCELPPTSCVAICGMSWVKTIQDSANNQKHCENQVKCNWMGDHCHRSSDQCESSCEDKGFFCGVCTDPSHCLALPGILSEEECKEVEACYLPNGKMELLSKEECEQRGMCSQPCHDGLGCESRSGMDNMCVSPEDRNACKGEWEESLELCTYPRYSQQMCGAAGLDFYSCSSLGLEECEVCYNDDLSCPINQTLLQCHVVPRVECEDRQQCESSGGYCDDADWYTNFGNQTDDFGACLIPPNYNSFQVQATCSGGRVLTPEGCLSKGYRSRADCSVVPGAYYRTLAKKESECTKDKGCANYDQVHSLAPMNQSNCEECGFEMKSYYKWTPAKWKKGKPVKPEWKKASLEPIFTWTQGIEWNALYKLFTEAASTSVLADMRSQALCDFNSKSVPIEVFSCACSGGDDEQDPSSCFADSRHPIESGTGRPCIGLGSTVQTLESKLKIADSAVDATSPSRCVDVSLSTISAYSYQQGEQVAFSPLTKVRDYDSFNIVKNRDSAIVGRVMSNGLEVIMNGDVKSYTVCLTNREDVLGVPPPKFDTWDLGVPRASQKDFLRPLMLVPKGRAGEETEDNFICFEIDNPKREERYFLIARVSNPAAKDGSLYGSQSIAWWTFAALYTLLGAWCLFTFIAHFFGYNLHYYFLGLFFFLFAMCVIRGIYFYLLAARVFDQSTSLAVAYFLIEFPTLLYFTAFSCLASFWIFLLLAHQQSNRNKLLVIVSVLFNAFLYLLFVVLIVLFETLSSSSTSLCKGRVTTEDNNTNQQIVSLFYQSFMAGVSLLLAMVVSFSGGKLLFGLKKRNFEAKVAMVTVVCALGLLLHCSFILYLTSTLEYDFVVIVCMIVLSELLPIFYVACQFSILRGMCCGKAMKLPSYNKQGKFHKAITFLRSRGSTLSKDGTSSPSNLAASTRSQYSSKSIKKEEL